MRLCCSRWPRILGNQQPAGNNPAMFDSLEDLLQELPRRPQEVWQGGLFRLPSWVVGEDREPYRPYVPLWLVVRSDKLHLGEAVPPEDRTPQVALTALLELAQDSQLGGYLPGSLEVTDADLAEFLAAQLAPANIEVRQVDRLPAVEQALEEFAEHLGHPLCHVPGPLDGRDVTVERMQRFAEAAANFYRAAPWQYLTDVDLINIEEPQAPAGMACIAVLGAAGQTFGLGLFGSTKEYFDYRNAVESPRKRSSREAEICAVTFGPITGLPIPDADLWEAYGLPVADRQAYPVAMKHLDGGKIVRWSADELTFLEGLLRALGETDEAMIDSGRWSRVVTTADGPMTVTLAIPDLLVPPTFKTWIDRGFTPDRRGHERMFADMDRYFRQHPPADADEYSAAATRLFSGRCVNELITQPETQLERAQELCFQAFDTFGRRRVLLARQALELCADCADAHVILAEEAGSPQAAKNHYAQGVAAGERSLGAEAFDRDAEHFWGISATRPYMRARFGLAQSLSQLGQHEEAVSHYQELIRLNPNDNQGVRYLLMPRLLQLGRDVEAARLLKQFEEPSANWAYARALLAFRLSGPSAAARKELREALRINLFVPPMLLATEPLRQPESYQLGSPEEAAFCADELRPAFTATPGALDWLAAESHRPAEAAKLRQRERQRDERRARKEQKKRKRR